MSCVYVTGGSRGIGAAVVRAFAFKGWSVAFTYLHSEKQALKIQDEARQSGLSALAVQTDVTDSAQTENFVAAAAEEIGPPDALVCCAGIALPQSVISDISDADWHRVFAVNVDGTFYAIRAALPYFLQRKQGSIVTVSSMWGQVGGSCEVPYSASKGAVISLTRALAKELGPSGIRVNCVSPGVIRTDMNADLTTADLDTLCEETPLGRIGTPQEVARCVRFLCTDGSEFITGQVVAPNGGIVI